MSQVDHCSKSGADALAKRIKEYWARERGAKVKTVVMLAVGHAEPPIYGVRSDLVDGRPRC